MSTTRTPYRIGSRLFTVVAVLVAITALYQWAAYLVLWSEPAAMADAFVWTFLTVVAFLPVFAIDYARNRGE